MAIGRPVEAVADIPRPRRAGGSRWSADSVAGGLGALGARRRRRQCPGGPGRQRDRPYDPVATDYGAMLAPDDSALARHGRIRSRRALAHHLRLAYGDGGLRVRSSGHGRGRDRRRSTASPARSICSCSGDGHLPRVSADHPGARGGVDPGHRHQNVIVAIAIPMIPAPRSSRGRAHGDPRDAVRGRRARGGFRHRRIILRHMLPNVMAPYLIMLTAYLGPGDLGRGIAHVPRARRLRADAAWGLMLRAPRCSSRSGAVDGDLSGPRDQPGRLRLQPVRRLVARCARPAAPRAVTGPNRRENGPNSGKLDIA